MTFYVFCNDVSKKRKKSQKYQVFWISIEILASNLPDVMGSYRHLSHTVLSCIVFLCPHIWARCLMFLTVTYRYRLPVIEHREVDNGRLSQCKPLVSISIVLFVLYNSSSSTDKNRRTTVIKWTDWSASIVMYSQSLHQQFALWHFSSHTVVLCAI